MKHVHKYERRKLGSWKKSGHEIYKCVLPGCNHYLTIMESVVGRYSKCWGDEECLNEVEMTRYLVFNERRKHPLCDDCKQERKIKKMTTEEIQLDIIRQRAIDKLMEMEGE